MNSLRRQLLGLFLLLAAAAPAAASSLWGTYSGSASIVPLSQVNPDTGAILTTTQIQTGLGAGAIDDMAGDPAMQGATLWGVKNAGGGVARLVAFDGVTKTFLSAVDLAAAQQITALAIDPTSGDFYGTSSQSLYRITPATGATTLVGATATPTDRGLGFDSAGNLYGISGENKLIAVDKATGGTALVATLGVFRMEDIAVRPETGIMYGIGYGPDYSLYQINLATGALVNVGPSIGRPSSLAFTGVPEPQTAVLAVVGLAAGTSARRPRKPRRDGSQAAVFACPV